MLAINWEAVYNKDKRRRAYGVHRFSAHQVRLEREDGQKIDLKRLIKHQKYATVREYHVWVWDLTHTKRFALRLVIALLPRKQAMQAQARIRLKKGPKANLAPAWWAGVMLLGTTLPQEQWSSQDVVKLYRARWKIEESFRFQKSELQIASLRLQG